MNIITQFKGHKINISKLFKIKLNELGLKILFNKVDAITCSKEELLIKLFNYNKEEKTIIVSFADFNSLFSEYFIYINDENRKYLIPFDLEIEIME